MAYEFKLPDIGEGVVEGEIVRWLVAEGEQVQADQPMVEVMTDKATVEIPAPRAGKILRRMYAEGQICPVGQVLVSIEEVAGAAVAAGATGAAATASSSASASQRQRPELERGRRRSERRTLARRVRRVWRVRRVRRVRRWRCWPPPPRANWRANWTSI